MSIVNADEIETHARAMLDNRITAVRTLAETRAHVAEARARLQEAEATDGRAFADAVRAGWTEQDLKALGFDPPTRRAPGRPRGPKRADRTTPAPDAGAASDESGLKD